MSKVSVIIPTFNCEDLLPRAVESALNQDYRDLEVIVIDDGSTDETEHLVELYAGDPRFRYLKQENLGPGAARNLGLRESTGNYVTFLDSDDYLAPQMISRLAAVLDADENLDLVYCNLVHVEVEDRESFDYDVGKTRAVPSGDILPALLLGGYFPVHSVLVRRSAVERAGGFDEDRKLVEDYDLWLRIAATGGRAHYLDERLAYYQRRSGSRSKEPDQTPEATLCKLMRLYPDQCGHALARLQQECLESWRALRRARDESAASARDLRRDLLQCRRDCERYRKGLEIVMNKPPVRVYRALKCALARLFGRRPSDGSQSEVPR